MADFEFHGIAARRVWVPPEVKPTKQVFDKRRKPFNPLKYKDYNTPIQMRARTATKRAVEKGILIKPNNCTRCGCEKKLDAHHPDYSKPLDVLWVCRSCHQKIHWEKRRQNGQA